MQTFRSQDMQKQAAALQEAAMKEPVLITYHDRPRLVLLSMDEYDRLRGRRGGATHPIAPLPNRSELDFLIAYSRGELTRSEAATAIGLDPSDVGAFAARMNGEKIPWPKADREVAERQADGLLELAEGKR
jgi:hypothetical protein